MNLQTLNDTPPWDWPENADQLILKVLREKSAPVSERVLAAELAGDGTVMNDNTAALLLAILQDSSEPEELRCKAAISLGPALDYGDTMEFDDPDDIMLSEKGFHEVQQRLRDIYQDTATPKKVRRKVLEAAVRAPMDWHSHAIQTAYASNDQEWVLTAVFCMGYVRGFEEQILESFKSENPDIFYEAVCAAGNWEIEAAWPYVKDLVTKGNIDKPLLIAAIDAAAHINPYEAVDILSELSNSNDEEIAEAVEDALAMAGLMAHDLPEDDLY
ncbi:MAG: hypothetical protein JSV88_28145 [Candidatus Aminicenantes bacterium]|nr:MAG: hypothetical protein JSV88_28145 [Candidatus Aminicenantes bacterium]